MTHVVLEAVRAARPIFEANRRVGEELARMAPATLDASRAADIYRMFAPRELGGCECSYPEITAVFEELGYSDPTIPWHLGNTTSVSALTHYLPQEVAREILADNGPYGLGAVPKGRAVPVDGGYLLTGRWPFMTGVLDATWASVLGLVMEGEQPRKLANGGPDMRSFIVKVADLTIHETWGSASAMRGTGSHSPEAVGVFVPEARAVSPSLRTVVTPSPIARLPFGSLSPVTNAAICVGIARRAVDALTGVLSAKRSNVDGTANRERPGVQVVLGQAHAAVAALLAGLQVMSEELWAAACAGEGVSSSLRARMWGTMYWTQDEARQVVQDVIVHATSELYASRNPIETCYRDMLAINASMEDFRVANVSEAGRYHLGLPPAGPTFLA